MKFEPNASRLLYVPQNDHEADLCYFAITQMTALWAGPFGVWRDEERGKPDREGAWFSASCRLPILEYKASTDQNRPHPLPVPHTVMVQLALPVTFLAEPLLFCRQHPRMTPECRRWLITCLDKLVYDEDFGESSFDESMLLQYTMELYRAQDYAKWRKHQPHDFLRRAATEVTPAQPKPVPQGPVLESPGDERREMPPLTTQPAEEPEPVTAATSAQREGGTAHQQRPQGQKKRSHQQRRRNKGRGKRKR